MHPLLARPERLAAYLGVWLIVGVLIAGSLSRQGLELSESLVLVLPLFLIYSFICLSAWYVCRAVPLRTSRAVRMMSAWVVSAAVAGGLWLGLAYAWIALLGSMPGLAEAPDRYRAQIPVLFSAAVLLFLLALVIHYLGLAFEETHEAEQRQFALQVQARDAELRALRAQLDPHFLYNCLNSIAALTTMDASGARRMCLLLGEFLRRTLQLGAQSQISLGDELALVDRFLAIEQVRFGERLQVSREIDTRALGCRVPPLFLQPLLENAVKHGIADMLEGGIVQLRVMLRDSHLAIHIVNPCDPDALPPLRTGTGMTNVRQRLWTSFGPSARMHARTEAGQFYVELELPVIADDQPFSV